MAKRKLERGELERALTELIAAEIKERGWSTRVIAERTGLKPSRANYLLRGETSMNITDLDRFANALGKRPEELWGAASKKCANTRPRNNKDTVARDYMATIKKRIAAMSPDEVAPAASRMGNDDEF